MGNWAGGYGVFKTFRPRETRALRAVQSKKDKVAYHASGSDGKTKRQSIWTDKEIEQIIDENRPDDPTLSRRLGRTIAAIHLRRWKVRSAKRKFPIPT